ncbi:MAG TPA: hypothetical protein VGF94_30270 [Kofleriaceae bacterium]
MGDETKPSAEPGAPVAKDAIDPELVKLRGPRPKVGLITSAGLVFLSILFLVRLSPDRKFSGASSEPASIKVADVLAGKVADNRYVTVTDAEPLVSHAIRATASQGSVGMRVVPARGTDEKLWLVVSGDGWEEPELTGYTGRLRRLSDLTFAAAVHDYAATHPRPMSATTAEVLAGLQAHTLETLTGETVRVADGDRVAFDIVEPDAATITCTLNDRRKDQGAWATDLAAVGLVVKAVPAAIPEEVRFTLATPGAVAAAQAALERAQLWAARVDPVTHHEESTWGALAASPPANFDRADVVAVYVSRDIPSDAYALITGEKPDDYWYVMWITVGLGAVALIFGWALVRAVRRDLLPARA